MAYRKEKTEKHLWIHKETASMLKQKAKDIGISESALASNIIRLYLEGDVRGDTLSYQDTRALTDRIIRGVPGT